MRRFSALCALIALSLVGLTACGSGNNGTVFGNPATINFSPTSTSLTEGTSENPNISVTDTNGNVLFSSGGAAATNVTFTSSDTNVLQIANNGLLCAGQWDNLNIPVVCSPFPPTPTNPHPGIGQATVTVTSGAITSTAITFFVHTKIERVNITGAPADLASCISQGSTAQLTATALAGDGSDITSTVGPPTWTAAIPDIVSIDANSVATAHDPGQTGLSASFGGFRGGSVPFTVCPVKSINIHVKGATDTSLSLDPSGTSTLTADVLDTNGHTIVMSKATASSTTAGLTWSATSPSATVTGLTTVLASVDANTTNDASVTAARAGSTFIVASCTPPQCNASVAAPGGTTAGFTPVYSNIVDETTSGTTASTTVFVTGTDTTQLVTINTSANTPGTTLTLTNQPNSLLIGKDGAHAFLGSAGGLMLVDANALTLTSTLATVPGKALAVNPTDGKTVVVSDTTNNRVLVGDATTGAFLVFPIANVTAAAYSTDGYRLYLASPTAVTVITQGAANKTLGFGATDVTPHPGGQLSYFASSTNVPVIATCDLTTVSTPTVSSAATLVEALANGSQVLLAGPNSLAALDVSNPATAGCAPSVTNTTTQLTMTGTPTQIIGTSNGTRAFILNDTPNIVAYDAASHSVSTIALSGTTAAFTGGVTLDGAQLYVGAPGSTPVVHRIDLATNTDAQQITASTTAFTPNLVAVRP
jgi:hypothetical protein